MCHDDALYKFTFYFTFTLLTSNCSDLLVTAEVRCSEGNICIYNITSSCRRVRRLQRWVWERISRGNCCYVAVCSAAEGASAPTGEKRVGAYRGGHLSTALYYGTLKTPHMSAVHAGEPQSLPRWPSVSTWNFLRPFRHWGTAGWTRRDA